MTHKIETPAYTQRAITLRTRDGRVLKGDHFIPQAEPARASILIGSSTATPRYIYTKFAQHLASMGFGVITFDYQGVAESRTHPLRKDRASKRSWGEQDLPAALERLTHEHPGVPAFLIGHSVGGQLMGLMPNRHLLHGVLTFGTSYGYWGYMPAPYRYFVWAMWHAVVPVSTRVLGYTPTRTFGFGEDMPAGVGQDWARWGRRRSYFEHEFRDEPGFKDLHVPWLSLIARDDQIATLQSAQALQGFYTGVTANIRVIDPGEFGYDGIGHMGFFSGERKRLWPLMTQWLEAQLEKP